MNFAHLLRRLCVLLSVGLILCGVTERLAQAQVVPRPAQKGRKYKVRIDSAPQQAAIYLDDEKYGIVGYTPWSGKLTKGNWKVILKKDNYETATRIIEVKRTRRIQESFIPMVRMERPAVVEVRGDADKNAFDAEVWVDGQLQGRIPATVNLADGRHLIEVKKKDFEIFSQWVSVKEGERLTVNPMLRPVQNTQTGSILVDADVPGAEILVDGNTHSDKTPSMIPGLTVGPHVVEVRKPPALPWRQTVQVEAGQTAKVRAELEATIGGQGGNIRVLSNVEGALVYLDGEEKGAAPIDLKNVKVGEHLVEVKAPGFATREERVTVAVGAASILKLDLQAQGAGKKGILKVLSATPDAEVFVDGKKTGTAPQELEIPVGEHFVVVSKSGFKTLEKKVEVIEGKVAIFSAELKAVGGIRFLSNPGAAEVMLDGTVIGQTPILDENIATGEHIVRFSLNGYEDFEVAVQVEGGKLTVVNATMKVQETGPTPEEKQRLVKGLSSFGARTLPKGRATIDISTGYPYYIAGGITVGAGYLGPFGFDAGVDLRTYFSRTDLALKARLMMYDKNPFSAGVFALVGGGGNLVDTSERGTWFTDIGAHASLTAIGMVTITGRAYLNMWTDRHCPGLNSSGQFSPASDPIDTCIAYQSGTLEASRKNRLDHIFGGEGKIFDRENGIRVMASIAIEVAINAKINAWALFEGGPFQDERAAFIDELYAPMFEEDNRAYFRAGATIKF